MRPPDKAAVARGRGDREELQDCIAGKAIPASLYPTRRFVVIVKAFGRLREWGKFGEFKAAAAAVHNLQKLGFDAHTERIAP